MDRVNADDLLNVNRDGTSSPLLDVTNVAIDIGGRIVQR